MGYVSTLRSDGFSLGHIAAVEDAAIEQLSSSAWAAAVIGMSDTTNQTIN